MKAMSSSESLIDPAIDGFGTGGTNPLGVAAILFSRCTQMPIYLIYSQVPPRTIGCFMVVYDRVFTKSVLFSVLLTPLSPVSSIKLGSSGTRNSGFGFSKFKFVPLAASVLTSPDDVTTADVTSG